MEIDPEVAALMDDLPPTKLPPALTNAGWGQTSMAMAYAHGSGRKVTPSQEFQPQYSEHCHQCGRPITNKTYRDEWADHAGSNECDGALVEQKLVESHFPTSEYERIGEWLERNKAKEAAYIERLIKEERERREQDRKNAVARKLAPCGSNKHSRGCQHQCSQHGDHFGFHECKFCRYLWK